MTGSVLRGLPAQTSFRVVAAALAGAVLAVAATLATSPQYQADHQLYLVVPATAAPGTGVERVRSYAALATSPAVLQPVIEQVGLRQGPEQLAEAVEAGSPAGSLVVDITVRGPDADRVSRVADAIGTVLPEVAAGLENPSTPDSEPVAALASTAAATPAAALPRPWLRNLLLGLAAGAAAGLLLARRRRAGRLADGDRAAAAADAPLLGIVPRLDGDRTPLYRRLVTTLRFRTGSGGACLVVTAALPGDGATTTACHLAVALAEAGEDVVLVDGDLRRPAVHDVLSLSGAVGLTTVLRGDIDVDTALQPYTPGLPLRVLTAGPVPEDPTVMVGSTRMAALLADLVDRGGTVVVDSPPLLATTDAALLARAGDGAVVVARAGTTRAAALTEACRTLRLAGVEVSGVVLNDVPRRQGPVAYPSLPGLAWDGGVTPPRQPIDLSVLDEPVAAERIVVDEPVDDTLVNRVHVPVDDPVDVPAELVASTPATPEPTAENGVAQVEALLAEPRPRRVDLAGLIGVATRSDPGEIPFATDAYSGPPARAVPTADLRAVEARETAGTLRPRFDPRLAGEERRWSAPPPAVRSQALQPEPVPFRRVGTSRDPVLDQNLGLDAGHPTVSRLEPGDDEPEQAMSTWHIDWGDLPTQSGDTRTGERFTRARHRN